MCFLFYDEAFDNVMKFKYLKYYMSFSYYIIFKYYMSLSEILHVNIISHFLEKEKAFEGK